MKWLTMIISAALLVASSCDASPTDEQITPSDARTEDMFATEIQRLLPVGTIRVDVMQPVVSPRLSELTGKFKAALQKNVEWWLEYVQTTQVKPGEPLPYHPNMGLSEAEYEEMLALLEQIAVRKVDEGTLIVTAQENTRLIFDGGRDLPDFTGIEIDLQKKVVKTPYGICGQRAAIEASADQKATGPWEGTSWKLSESDITRGSAKRVEFAIGRLIESGQGILLYEVEIIEDGSVTADGIVILYYDLK